MSVFAKRSNLTPDDVIEALRNFSPEGWVQVRLFMDVASPPQEIVSSIPIVDQIEPHPEEPPHTPEGNEIALEAVERMAGMLDISDPELGHWLAESPELSI